MKKLFLLSVLLIIVGKTTPTRAQDVDSCTAEMSQSISFRLPFYLVAFTVPYISGDSYAELAGSIAPATSDMTKLTDTVTVQLTERQTFGIYITMGYQAEGITAQNNAILKAVMLAQIQTRPCLWAMVQAEERRRQLEVQNIINGGVEKLKIIRAAYNRN